MFFIFASVFSIQMFRALYDPGGVFWVDFFIVEWNKILCNIEYNFIKNLNLFVGVMIMLSQGVLPVVIGDRLLDCVNIGSAIVPELSLVGWRGRAFEISFSIVDLVVAVGVEGRVNLGG